MENVIIEKCVAGDLAMIQRFYNEAIAFQQKASDRHWQPFEDSRVLAEIGEGRQLKLMIEGTVAAIFVVCHHDAFIWGDKEKGDAVYLHRIVTQQSFRGRNLIRLVIDWACTYGRNMGRRYLRMDTWGDNKKLISYYQACGFRFLGIITPPDIASLPRHYEGISLSLFEMEI